MRSPSMALAILLTATFVQGCADDILDAPLPRPFPAIPGPPLAERPPAERSRQAAEEASRLAAERAAAEETARMAEELAAREEAARRAAEQAAAEEAARLAAEQAAAEEAARLAAEQAAAEEAARLAAEQAAAEEAARLAAEQAAAEEAARLAAEQAAAEEAARLAAEQAAAEEAARLAAEQAAAEEAARLAAEQAAAEEAARLAAEQAAAEEAARLAAEQAAAEEAARLAAEQAAAEEAARLAAEQAAAEEAARVAAEQAAAEEAARLAAEQAAAEEAARLAAEQAAAEEAARLAALAAAAPPVGAAPGAQDVTSPVIEGQIAPRLQTLGSHSHPIQTDSRRAQLFFDQGLILAYGFNHKEAMRSFQEVSRLDPDSPMGYWGQALVLGPNINAPMDPDNEARAHALVEEARKRAKNGSARERAYVKALSARYTGKTNPDRAALDAAYAEAMGKLHEADPKDQDAATLYAESLMNLSPWDYWTADFKPYDRTKTILRVLEGVRAVNPGHPGANHLYIHTTEYAHPELGEAAADDLVDAAPGAGHLQHMPSHIYARIGRYADATLANEKAIQADEEYITTCRAQGIYPLAYYPHNLHFYWWTTSLQGRSEDSIRASRKVIEKTIEHIRDLPEFAQVFPVTSYFALVRFGRWQEVLAEPPPPGDLTFAWGIHHYARGLAYARLGNYDAANLEFASLAKLQRSPALKDRIVGANDAQQLLGLASAILFGEIAAEEGRFGDALASLHRAVLLQDQLNYTEPPDWFYPVRQSLGAVLLKAGRADEAEAVYWQDLRKNPENGWSLFGLAQAMRAQGKNDQAEGIERRFAKAWEAADVKLKASRF